MPGIFQIFGQVLWFISKLILSPKVTHNKETHSESSDIFNELRCLGYMEQRYMPGLHGAEIHAWVTWSRDTCLGYMEQRYMPGLHGAEIHAWVTWSRDTCLGYMEQRYMPGLHGAEIHAWVTWSRDTCLGYMEQRYMPGLHGAEIHAWVTWSRDTCLGYMEQRYMPGLHGAEIHAWVTWSRDTCLGYMEQRHQTFPVSKDFLDSNLKRREGKKLEGQQEAETEREKLEQPHWRIGSLRIMPFDASRYLSALILLFRKENTHTHTHTHIALRQAPR